MCWFYTPLHNTHIVCACHPISCASGSPAPEAVAMFPGQPESDFVSPFSTNKTFPWRLPLCAAPLGDQNMGYHEQ